MELADAIANYRVVGLDANAFIYVYQEHPQYLPIVRPLFARLDADPDFRIVTSIITLVEVMVLPIRLNRSDLVSIYTAALLATSNVATYPVDAAIARKAADLRAKLNLRTPDAIQVATAIVAGAEAFVTNDERLRRVQDIPILVIGDLAR